MHLIGCLYYLYQWCTVKQISDNEIYLLIKYIKSVLWRVVKRLSYIEDAWCLKVKLETYTVPIPIKSFHNWLSTGPPLCVTGRGIIQNLIYFDHAGNKTGKFLHNRLLPYAVIGKVGACNAIGSIGTLWLFHNEIYFFRHLLLRSAPIHYDKNDVLRGNRTSEFNNLVFTHTLALDKSWTRQYNTHALLNALCNHRTESSLNLKS